MADNILDVFPTPEPLVNAILTDFKERYDRIDEPAILDVGAGSGVWGRVARLLWPHATIVGVDIRPLHKPLAYDYWITTNLLTWEPSQALESVPPRYTLIMGNPPFTIAQPLVERALTWLDDPPFGASRLLLLLRLGFLATKERYRTFWKGVGGHQLEHVSVLTKRPSFTGGGTDGTDYGVYNWVTTQSGSEDYTMGTLDWLPWDM